MRSKRKMKTNEFIKFCKSLSNDDLADIDPAIEHAILGIGTEAGELLDVVKRRKVYHQLLDMVNIKEEAGDLLHYIARLLDACGWTFEEVLEDNVMKLQKRYPDGYSHKAGLARADKQKINREGPFPGGA